MASGEDMLREIEEEEAAADNLYRKMVPIDPKRTIRSEPNADAARQRYLRDFAPVIARQRRAQAGQPITNNPLKNVWLKLTGKDKLPTPDVFDPIQGIAMEHGMTAEEVRLEILAHPELYPDLAKAPPERVKKP